MSLARVMVGDEGMRALAQCKTLAKVTIRNLPLSEGVLAELLRLPRLQVLQCGELSIITIGRPTQEELARAVDELTEPNVFWAINRRHVRDNTPYLRWLLEHGANPNEERDHFLAVSVLALRNEIEGVELLLEFGADPNRREWWGKSPLRVVADYGRPEMIKFLVAHGADVNHQDRDGDTLLHDAAEYGDLGRAELLLRLGADPNLPNHADELPLALAKQRGDGAMTKLLQRRSKPSGD